MKDQNLVKCRGKNSLPNLLPWAALQTRRHTTDDCTHPKVAYPTLQDGTLTGRYKKIFEKNDDKKRPKNYSHPSGIGALRPGIRNVG